MRGEMGCPILTRCNVKVSINHYMDLCSRDGESYRKCKYYMSIERNVMTPFEWFKVMTGANTIIARQLYLREALHI